MPARTIMIQGTASGVGKSTVVTGLCRLLARSGIRCAPFKAQNMSLNAAVTPDGREIGLSQALQAEAAGIEPNADMNPVLLKPRGVGLSQVVLRGRPAGVMHADRYWLKGQEDAWEAITAGLEHLRERYDFVIIEGSGSPAEMNLRDRDLANMRVAAAAGAPVLLVGDIERGGVFAALLGTLSLLPRAERDRVVGLIVNRFHGDPSLFQDGVRYLEDASERPVLGVIPYCPPDLPEEDSLDAALAAPPVSLPNPPGDVQPGAPARSPLTVAAVVHTHTANFADMDPFRHVPGVQLRWARRPADLRDADIVLLPGSRNTIDDLEIHRTTGMADAILDASTRGAIVIGLCGGLQMMGEVLDDPEGLEGSAPGRTPGLGLLPLLTRFVPEKRTQRVQAVVTAPDPFLHGRAVEGYEIRHGRTEALRPVSPLLQIAGPSGSPDGFWRSPRLWGTYVHGIFDSQPFLCAFVASASAAFREPGAARAGTGTATGALRAPGGPSAAASGPAHPLTMRDRRESSYDRLADLFAASLDLDILARLAGIDRERLG